MPTPRKRKSRQPRKKSDRLIEKAKIGYLDQQEALQDKDADREWAAREILAESASQYLIDWDSDSDTGEKYSPTWEPKQNASKILVSRWKEDTTSKYSFVTGSTSANYSLDSTGQHDNFPPTAGSHSSSSSRGFSGYNRRNRVRKGGELSVVTITSQLQQDDKHAQRFAKDFSLQSINLRGIDCNNTETVDATPHCSDSENVRRSVLIEHSSSSAQPSAIEQILVRKGNGICSQTKEERIINLCGQSTQIALNHFNEDLGSPRVEGSSRKGHITTTFLEDANAPKAITETQHLKSTISCSVLEDTDETSGNCRGIFPHKLIASSNKTETYGPKLLPEKERATIISTLSPSQALNAEEKTLASKISDVGLIAPVDSSQLSQSGINPVSSYRIQNPQPNGDSLPPHCLIRQSYTDLSSLDNSDSTDESYLSSSITSASVPASTCSSIEGEEEELRSSIYNQTSSPTCSVLEADTTCFISNTVDSPVFACLNVPAEELNHNHSFWFKNQSSQRTEISNTQQSEVASISEHRNTSPSTFETIPATSLSSYVSLEPVKVHSPGETNSAKPIHLSTVGFSEVQDSEPVFGPVPDSLDIQNSPIIGDSSDILILAPTSVPWLQSSASSSDTEDISTPFETQIPIVDDSLHDCEAILGIAEKDKRTKFWGNYIFKKFGVGTFGVHSTRQKRINSLLKLLCGCEKLPGWKVDALILLFVAKNPNTIHRSSKEVVLLAKELSEAILITPQKEKHTATHSHLLRQDCFEALKRKHHFFSVMEGANQITSDSALSQSSQSKSGNPASLNNRRINRYPLPTSPEQSVQPEPDDIANNVMTDEAIATLLSEPSLEEQEFMFPLPMHGPTAEQYRNIIPYYNTHIKRFASKNHHHVKHEFRPVKRLLEHLHNITYHVDLEDDGSFTPKKISKAVQSKWDETCSSKFRALAVILDDLKNRDIHVVIAVRSGRPRLILESWLASKGIQFRTISPGEETHNANRFVEKCLSISIITEEVKNIGSSIGGVDAIFSLDYSFSTDRRKMKSLQIMSKSEGRLAPIITFFIFASQEHILRCIPHSLPEIEQLQLLASRIVGQRLVAGILPSGFPGLTESASLVSEWLLSKSKQSQNQGSEVEAIGWPFEPISKLQGIMEAQNVQPNSTSKDIYHPLKRANDLNDENEYSKRLRITSQSEFTLEKDVSTTHISETNVASSQFNQNSELQLLRSSHKSPRIKEYVVGEAKSMMEQLRFADEKIKDYEGAIEDLRMRSEQQRVDMTKVQEENKQLVFASERDRASNIELAKVADEARSRLHRLLDQGKQACTQGVSQEECGTSNAEVDLRLLKEENDKLEKKVREQDGELNFIRERYQYASDAAVKSTEQVTSLGSQLKIAQRQASGEATRLKQLHLSNYASRLEDENKSLKAINENLAELLWRKEDELRTLRTRMVLASRAASIPRSPRIGPSGSLSGTGSPPISKPFHHLRTLQD